MLVVLRLAFVANLHRKQTTSQKTSSINKKYHNSYWPHPAMSGVQSLVHQADRAKLHF